MLKFLIGSLLILAAILVFMFKNASELQMRTIEIKNAKIKAEVASSLPQKFQGLSGRDFLCASCGMLFPYENEQLMNFSMRGMRFPLDFVFIRQGFVVEIRENVPAPSEGQEPQGVYSRVSANQVLEVNAGFIRSHGIAVGDAVR